MGILLVLLWMGFFIQVDPVVEPASSEVPLARGTKPPTPKEPTPQEPTPKEPTPNEDVVDSDREAVSAAGSESGTVLVAVTYADGGPVPGLECILIPLDHVTDDAQGRESPLHVLLAGADAKFAANWAAGRRAQILPHRRTGPDGRASWKGLEPGRYRWGVSVEAGAVEVSPPYEEPRYFPSSEGILANANWPSQLSGVFEVVAGEEVSWTGVAARGVLLGRIVLAPGEELAGSVTIRVGRHHAVDLAAGGRAVLLEHERLVQLQQAGAFRIDRLSAGETLLDVSWSLTNGDRFHCLRSISMPRDSVYDVGAFGGSGARVTIRLPWLRKGANVTLFATNGTEQGPVPVGWMDARSIRPDEKEVRFAGLERGEYRLSVSGDFPAIQRDIVVGDEDVVVALADPTPREVRLELFAQAWLGSGRVKVVAEGGYRASHSVVFQPRPGPPASAHSGAVVTMALPDRQCAVVCSAVGVDAAGDAVNYCGLGTLLPGESWLQCELRRATEVTVLCTGEVRFVEVGVRGSDDVLWSAPVDDGRVVLASLPAECALWCRSAGATEAGEPVFFSSGKVGEGKVVQLTGR